MTDLYVEKKAGKRVITFAFFEQAREKLKQTSDQKEYKKYKNKMLNDLSKYRKRIDQCREPEDVWQIVRSALES